MLFSRFVFLALAASMTAAHGDMSKRDFELLHHTRRSLATCQDSLAKRGMFERGIERRQALAERARRSLGLDLSKSIKKRQDSGTMGLNVSHETDLEIASPYTKAEYLFDSGNSSCVAWASGEQGPFYVSGEYVREDLREDQPGVPLWLDLQFIDVSTCNPISAGIFADIWNCNATGVYAGVLGAGNGNSDDLSNANTTFLRGLQPTDDEGVITFETIFPGHYSGRATHIHTILHPNGTWSNNGTFQSGYGTYTGQIFFDQDLITQVEATEPYNTNTINITENADDHVITEQEAGTQDPFVQYALLGDDISEGILAWTVIGVDLTTSYFVTPAYNFTSDGGIEVDDGSGGLPTGGAGGPSGSASGELPSGTPPSRRFITEY